MKVSLNWIRDINQKYQCSADPAPNGVDDLIEKIGAQLGGIEEVINLGERYADIVVVKVVAAAKHPNADKLKVCLVDDGGATKDVARNADGLVEVVCGAPNVAAGQLVAWIPPGATVPATFDKDPFVLEARELRGVVSNGMLASAKELAIGDSHEGLLIIDQDVKPGTPLAEVYGLNDYIVDIENKMFTHRPDLFGQLGIVREIAGIYGHAFVSPPIYKADKTTGQISKQHLDLEITNDIPKLVPRFMAQAFLNIKVAPSPIWLQSYLSRVGIRPINNIVDITNYFMMLTGQPLHAYDYDKLKTGKIGVRLSKKGEQIKLLNGKTLTLNDGATVITNGQDPIGLGGIMGGADTEVDNNTKNIVLECATFDMNHTRKTAMAYGLFTDAVTRYTKGQSPWQNDRIVAWAAGEIIHQAGGLPDGTVYDLKADLKANPTVKLTHEFVNLRLGTNLSVNQMAKLLTNVEFIVKVSGDSLAVTAPFWRTDIEIPEDIVEEVGRLHGYDKLPKTLPSRPIEPVDKNQLMEFKDQLRQILSEFGANEALTYSFVHSDLLKKTNQDPAKAYMLSNALSPSLQYFRFNLIPSLLDKVHSNIKAGYDKFAMFEIGKGHDQDHKDKDGLPQEFELLSLIYTASPKSNPSGAAFYQAKQYLTQLAAKLGVDVKYSPLDKLPQAQLAQTYDVSRSAFVGTTSGIFLGIIGEFQPSVQKALKLPRHTAGWEIDIEALLESRPAVKTYQLLPRFPQTHQDLCLRTGLDLSYAELTDFVSQVLSDLSANKGYVWAIEALDIYQPQVDKFKQITWRIVLSHPERTLTTQEVNELLDSIAQQSTKKFKAERI